MALQPTIGWYEDATDTEEEALPGLIEYDITATPNDFNVQTILNYIERGVITIPGFQRNYVWDLKRASALIESLIIGLPIPQIFLFQESKNKFLVIDGQQRLMSLYYFMKKRFPKPDVRPYLRKIILEQGSISEDILHNDSYFETFNLRLPPRVAGDLNPLNGKNYSTLGDYQITLDLRTIRNVVVKQDSPVDDDDSSIHEIFNRLNSGGVVLTPQEIRISLYHSKFYAMLDRLNIHPGWRRLVGLPEPDLNMKDLEIILRGFAMLFDGHNYRPSMNRFLNSFSKKSKNFSGEDVDYLENLFTVFVDRCSKLETRAFYGTASNRFNISIFDSVFATVCRQAAEDRSFIIKDFSPEDLERLKGDDEFTEASQYRTANKTNVALRLSKANKYLLGG